ncbi:uncharacterized protein LOC128256348 isoform X1 [Drosophila gunungcola]|uniref:uncharacterized protein LOC128256348 isoform X1 n=1 Tax=Drosophila gunungcola TaxID=103775 RepID=UPI0022E8103C|nr:uncharacterized protein LOC128256348 isoform X1 [Drosophila gunungcola]
MGTKQKRATTSAQAIVANNDDNAAGGVVEVKARDCAALTLSSKIGDKAKSAVYCDFDLDVTGYEQTAAALSPTEVAAGVLSSSRTSMNNSTENLSYSSDNFYGDDLIILDDDDLDAEEMSINSDDCVYAYRGGGAGFDIDLGTATMGRGRDHLDFDLGPVSAERGVDDETEFLEMDFEPDPSSELEFTGGAQDMGIMPQANLLLMQRDYSQISGISLATPMQGRQLYSSPIDDFLQEDVFQQQKQRLSKKFARISLNLNQIKDRDSGGSGIDIDLEELIGGADKVESTGDGHLVESAQAHSLPNALYTDSSFGRSKTVPSEHPEPKVTGAKPKRLSQSSSVMSKSSSSSKSRRTQPSISFDERCYSCTDFRGTSVSSWEKQQSGLGQSQAPPILVASAAVLAIASSSSCMAHFDLSYNEENCLDCLEKEFLANTIGKSLDQSTCPKCRRQVGGRGSSLSLYAWAEQTRCRSGSPGYFGNSLYAGWLDFSGAGTVPDLSLGPAYNQKIISCDNNFNIVQLLNKSFPSEPLVARLFTDKTCDEKHLVQALDKLHVTYDREILHSYFNLLSKRRKTDSSVNLKQLLTQASKRQGNHRKVKRLIELVTHKQIIVQFKRKDVGTTELVPIKVADILDAWKRYRDLSLLRQLNARFHCTNVLGKVGHIVRQATVAAFTSAQASSTPSCSRALPEVLMIPQYYESGELTLTRKC